MKNVLSILTIAITAMITSENIKAQVQTNPIPSDLARLSSKSKSGRILNVNSKALRDFVKSFPNVFDATWYENEYAFIAKFSRNEIATMVGYGKKGDWLFTIKRYDETYLPKRLRAQVKSAYYDFGITGIDEVRVPQSENPIHILRLRNREQWKTVRLKDGEMEVIREFHE